MNTIFKYILISSASALVGGFAGYFICKKQLQNKFDEELSEKLNEELENIRKVREENLLSKEESIPPKDDISVPAYFENEPADYLAYLEDVKRIIQNEFPNARLDSYRLQLAAAKLIECSNKCLNEDETTQELMKLFAEVEPPPEDEPEEDEEEIYNDKPEEDSYTFNDIMDEYRGRIEVIPNSDYRNLPPTFEFVTYHYFEEDDILIDDGDMIIEDIDGTVGDALVHFDEEEDDGDTVYLINGDYGLAIEIVRLHSSYAGWSGWGR